MSFLRNINPTGAIGDFVTVFREAGSRRWYVSIAAATMTLLTFSLITGDSWKRARPMPQVTYITSWPADRTEAETRAFIAENQKRKEALEAAQNAADEDTRKLWKTLGRVSGMDVDAMDAKGAAERAEEQAAEKARIEQLTGQKADH